MQEVLDPRSFVLSPPAEYDRPAVLHGRFYPSAKRTLDLVLAAGMLLLLVPAFLLLALLIRLDSPGPVLYRQERLGKDGRPFSLLKFRSMHQDADQRLERLLAQNEADGPLFKLRCDPRVTRVGRWLRRSSLDELPQLVNVLRGEMSLVGPRPPLAREVARYESWQARRLVVRPGLTGLWQIAGRSDLGFVEGIRLDLWYVDHASFWLDLRVLLATLPAVISARGAY